FRRGRPLRRELPDRGRSRPRPRRLLPPLRLRGLGRRNEMSGTKHTDRNLAARMGRWSASHWKTATFGWLAFVLVAFGLGGIVGTKNISNSAGPRACGRMDGIREAGFEQPGSERVLIQSRSQRVGTIAFDAAIADVVAR